VAATAASVAAAVAAAAAGAAASASAFHLYGAKDSFLFLSR